MFWQSRADGGASHEGDPRRSARSTGFNTSGVPLDTESVAGGCKYLLNNVLRWVVRWCTACETPAVCQSGMTSWRMDRRHLGVTRREKRARVFALAGLTHALATWSTGRVKTVGCGV